MWSRSAPSLSRALGPAYGSVTVAGRRIAYRSWGDPDAPAVYLVHGGSANSSWWDHIGPRLAEDHRVVAHDLSGHGDSSHAARYNHRIWATELIALVEETSRRPAPVIVGHSMGGGIALRAAEHHGAHLGGLIMIDTVVRDVTEEEMAVRRARAVKRHRVYSTAEEAYARFHTVPETAYAAPDLLRHIAEESLVAVPGGWTWKFDMGVFGQQTPSPSSLVPLACPVKLVRGAEGLVDSEMGSVIADGLGCAPPEVVEHCGHHVLLDRPGETVRILRAVLGEWAPTRGPRG